MEREEGREGRKEDGQKGEGDSSCLVPVKSSSLPARHRENIECRRPLRASFNGSRERFQESRDIASKRIWRGKDERRRRRRRRLLAQRKSLKLVVKRSEDGSKVVGRKKKKKKRKEEPRTVFRRNFVANNFVSLIKSISTRHFFPYGRIFHPLPSFLRFDSQRGMFRGRWMIRNDRLSFFSIHSCCHGQLLSSG